MTGSLAYKEMQPNREYSVIWQNSKVTSGIGQISTVIFTAQEAKINKLPESRLDTHHTPKENQMLWFFTDLVTAGRHFRTSRTPTAYSDFNNHQQLIKGKLFRGY